MYGRRDLHLSFIPEVMDSAVHTMQFPSNMISTTYMILGGRSKAGAPKKQSMYPSKGEAHSIENIIRLSNQMLSSIALFLTSELKVVSLYQDFGTSGPG